MDQTSREWWQHNRCWTVRAVCGAEQTLFHGTRLQLSCNDQIVLLPLFQIYSTSCFPPCPSSPLISGAGLLIIPKMQLSCVPGVTWRQKPSLLFEFLWCLIGRWTGNGHRCPFLLPWRRTAVVSLSPSQVTLRVVLQNSFKFSCLAWDHHHECQGYVHGVKAAATVSILGS